ncbi:hypothetical protein Patl1_27930 [Pistacia atlantica]|uniref:Uncharacterized protein n=1 Tax=Pistacia atlantica TaxID=434234 RepID=A0ACC1BGQ5_9ROSI|nr:hypothetical protein Patl1_27930 [Pistacia atlantica]
MAFSSTFSPTQSSFSCLSQFPQPSRKNPPRFSSLRPIKATAEPPKETPPPPKTDGKDPTSSTTAVKPAAAAPKRPKKPVYSSDLWFEFQYLSVGHPPFYKGLDYIYEDRGEILDLRIFETGEYALVSNFQTISTQLSPHTRSVYHLVAWVGIPTAPAWLPTDMLIESDKLDYERL